MTALEDGTGAAAPGASLLGDGDRAVVVNRKPLSESHLKKSFCMMVESEHNAIDASLTPHRDIA
jgi:hypothetical protein